MSAATIRAGDGSDAAHVFRAELSGRYPSCASERTGWRRWTPRDSSSSTTVAKTWSTVMCCIHTLFRHGEVRLLYALTHGLQGTPAHSTRLRSEGAAKRAGCSGPNSVTTSSGVRVAKCAGPLSLVTSASARV